MSDIEYRLDPEFKGIAVKIERLGYLLYESVGSDRVCVRATRYNTPSGLPTRIEVTTPSRLIAWQTVLAGAIEVER